MDLARELNNQIVDGSYSRIVSILVLMDLAREFINRFETFDNLDVSILVLMDLARECGYILPE